MSFPVDNHPSLLDKDTFDAIFRKYYNDLCKYSFFLSLSHTEAEDVVQDVFINLWENRKIIKIDTSLKAYLFSSVKNKSLNVIKHKKVKEKFSASQIFEVFETNNSGETQENHLNLLQMAIQELPPKRREIFTLNKFEGLRYQDIATKLNISIKTVENQMGEALKFLRERLSQISPSFLFALVSFRLLFEILVGVFTIITVIILL